MTPSPETIRALDEAVRKYLLDGRDLYFHRLLLSTFVVALGIVMEGPEMVHDIREELDRFLRRCRRSEATINPQTGLPVAKHRLKLIPFFSAVGLLLIAVGVTGEFVLEALVSQSDEILQSFDNTLTKFGVAAASERAAEANAKAEALKAENLRLAKLIQPRYLDEKQLRDVETSMRPFSGHNVLIASQWIDLEAAALAKQIKASLNRAGVGKGNTFDTMTLDKIGAFPEIETGRWGGGGGTVGVKILREGITIWGSDRPAVAALADALPKTLAVTTPPQSENPYPGYGSMSLIMFVGTKPIPDAK